MTRGVGECHRPKDWSPLKQSLGSLFDRIEGLDNELLYSNSIFVSENLTKKMSEMEQLLEKILAKFKAACRPSSTEC